MLFNRLIIAGLLVFVSFASVADEKSAGKAKETSKRPMIETSWLSGEAGFKGALLGAEIISVAPDKNDNTKDTIAVIIPVPQGQSVEEVLVIEQADPALAKPEVKYDVKVIKDYEGGRSGVVVTLGKNVPFKLMFNYVEYTP